MHTDSRKGAPSKRLKGRGAGSDLDYERPHFCSLLSIDLHKRAYAMRWGNVLRCQLGNDTELTRNNFWLEFLPSLIGSGV